MLTASTSARADDDRYRVEVLVLLHLQHTEDGEETDRLRDYSAALDFLTPVPEPEPLPPECEPEPSAPPEGATAPEVAGVLNPSIVGPADETLAEDETAEDIVEEEEPVDPNAVVHVTEMGPEMQEAWRRLRLSGPFRPLQYLAWEQGSSEPFPTLRIHDETVVFEDDPYADLRAAADELEALYAVEAEEVVDDALPDCTPPEEDPLPGPVYFYGLDGTVSLLRSRFLHLELDLQWREPLLAAYDQDAGEPLHALLPGASERNEPSDLELPAPVFRAYDLVQRRQVRSGRMEYFDSPVLGVLAWITPIPVEAPEER